MHVSLKDLSPLTEFVYKDYTLRKIYVRPDTLPRGQSYNGYEMLFPSGHENGGSFHKCNVFLGRVWQEKIYVYVHEESVVEVK